uniref:ASH domain-containing protein n=1 Tax=Elaeophora elaphi TaxID=1147741 RepID=A0A0R3RW51_9BILA
MSSSSWEIQEDRFDDIDSETDEKSVYEDDFFIDDHPITEHEKLSKATIANHSPPRLSTIVEESNIVVEGVDSVFGLGLKRQLSGENVDVIDESSMFKGIEKLQRDQESFYEHKFLAQDDFRFCKQNLEKENSWEPSVHNSPPPTPKICIDELAAFNMTNSRLMPATSFTQNRTSQDAENIPATSSDMQHTKKEIESKQNFSEHKMSTPKSTDTSLRNLSINCISSIYPEIVSPKSTREVNLKFNGPFINSCKMSKIVEEPSLSSSAIDRVLQKENFDDDDALVEALLQAKTRPRLKLNFPEIIAAKRAGKNGQMERFSIRHEESADAVDNMDKSSNDNDRNQIQKGITNKAKKLKTARKLNSLRQNSNSPGDLPVTKWTSENLTAQSDHSLEESQGKFLKFGQSFVYFGFVDIKCRANRSMKLQNISSKSLNLKLQLRSNTKVYEILEEGIVVLKPQEVFWVHIIFQPPYGAYFSNTLTIKVLNAEHINYYIPISGSGGVANLTVLTQSGLTMLRDGSFVLTAQGVTNISFDVENKGERDAFVRVVVLNKETKKAVSRCTVAPSDCVSILRRSKQKFIVEVPSLCGEESNNNSNRSFPHSSFSMPSAAGNIQYYVQLLWGEEAQRCRLKKYEDMQRADFIFNGHTFTKCEFMNEEKCKSTVSENICCGFYDRNAFELGLRVTLISVVDNRLSILSRNSYFAQEEMLAGSVILEPNATLSSLASSNKSIVEDISSIFSASRVL